MGEICCSLLEELRWILSIGKGKIAVMGEGDGQSGSCIFPMSVP